MAVAAGALFPVTGKRYPTARRRIIRPERQVSELSSPMPTRQEAVAIREAINRKELAATRQRSALGRLLGLSETDVLAIQHLAAAGRLTPTQLGGMLGMTSGGATALVQRLEREGFVAREPHPHDRRSALLRLTPATERRAGDALAPLVGAIDDLVSRLPTGDQRAITRFLTAVADAGERHADELARRADAAAHPVVGSPVPALWA
jgi:DNA-binding MarR family transcriptional regulator